MVTDDVAIRERSYAFKDVGRRPGGERWEYPRLGWNYRTSEYLAALLLARLPLLEEQTNRRNANARYLSAGLAEIEGLRPPEPRDWMTRHGYHLYTMHYDPSGFGNTPRERFAQVLQAEGIPCSLGYSGPLTDETALKTVRERYPDRVTRWDCPNVETLSKCSLWLPQQMLLGDSTDMDDIVEAVSKASRLLN